MITPITPVKNAIANIRRAIRYGLYLWGDVQADWGDAQATWGNINSITPITPAKNSITPINTPKS